MNNFLYEMFKISFIMYSNYYDELPASVFLKNETNNIYKN